MQTPDSLASRGYIPADLPITNGSLKEFAGDPVAFMRQLYETHGTLAALQDGDQRIYFVFGPDYNRLVLSDSNRFHSQFFAIRGPKKSSQRRLTCGLLQMNGEEHKRHRRFVMGPFQRKTIATYQDSISQMTRDLLDGWRPGEVRDISAEMTQFMLRVASSILFGFDVPELSCEIGRMTEHWVDLNHQAGLGAFISSQTVSRKYEELLEVSESLEAKIRDMIHLRRSDAQQGNDVLSLLLRAHDEQGHLSDDELVGQAALIFGAAHLTTAHTLSWTLFLLAQHPSVMRSLHEELQESVRGDSPAGDEIERLPLTERVIKESMRILPASAYVQRITSEPVTLGPFTLPRSTPVLFSQYMTHHMRELFDEPETFRPDRWLSINPSPYAYLPFGAGPRMCIGGPLAMMTLKIVLPTILKRFRMTVIPDSEITGKVVSTMLGATTPVPMLLSPPGGRFESSPVGGNIHSMVHLHEAPAHAAATRRAA